MWSRRITRMLRRLYRRPVRMDPGHKEALLEALLAQHQRLYPAKEEEMSLAHGFLTMLKFALATAAVLAVGIGACQMPAEYQTEIGTSLALTAPTSEELKAQIEEIVGHARDFVGAGKVQAQIRVTPETTHITLYCWGTDIPSQEVFKELTTRFPILEGATFEEQPIEDVIQGTLGGKLSKGLFNVDIDDLPIEEARQRLLEKMQAQGIEHPQVEIQEVPGEGRRIKIKGFKREGGPEPRELSPSFSD